MTCYTNKRTARRHVYLEVVYISDGQDVRCACNRRKRYANLHGKTSLTSPRCVMCDSWNSKEGTLICTQWGSVLTLTWTFAYDLPWLKISSWFSSSLPFLCMYNTGCWKQGWTHLHSVAWDGNLDAARSLLQVGHPVDPQLNTGHTPLHLAAQEGKIEMARYCVATICPNMFLHLAVFSTHFTHT